MEHSNFQIQARNWWTELKDNGWEGFKIMIQHKLLKCKLKVYNREVQGPWLRKRKFYNEKSIKWIVKIGELCNYVLLEEIAIGKDSKGNWIT